MTRSGVRAFRALLVTAMLVLAIPAGPAVADAPSGAVFTTLPDGSEVNFNIYDNKSDVYLDGGPGPGAPQTAAGLDDGTYYFMVTEPGGKTLLSTDPISCRQFVVLNGIITGTAGPCPHVTGLDIDHGATTVQLMPYNDTPNNGGEYKVWVTNVNDYNCAGNGAKFCFVPGDSKTDNWKVGDQGAMEIDTRFWTGGSTPADGLGVTWTDTHGAKNAKWSYYAPKLQVNHEAHVEAVEVGRHYITVANQARCAVGSVYVANRLVGSGPRSVPIDIKRQMKGDTVFVDVYCR